MTFTKFIALSVIPFLLMVGGFGYGWEDGGYLLAVPGLIWQAFNVARLLDSRRHK